MKTILNNLYERLMSAEENTAKLASNLVLLTGIINLVMQSFSLPNQLGQLLLLVVGILSVLITFFQTNTSKVITHSTWILLGYTVVNYLASAPELKLLYPNSSQIMLFVAGCYRLYAGMTIDKSTPPTA